MIKLKRIYEGFDKNDGYRVLVDRLWPRGISKEDAHLDIWLKDIGPTNELRKWFNHEVEKWDEFEKRYKKELKDNPSALKQLQQICKKEKTVTLLYGAKDEQHNQAVVILSLLK